MYTTKMISTKFFTFAVTVAAILLIPCANAGFFVYEELVSNGDFELPVTGGDANDNFDFDSWLENSNVRMDSNDSGRVPGINPNQVARFFTSSSLTQDLGTVWATSDNYELSFNASEVWWRTGATGDSMSISIYQTSDSAVLWTTGAINLDGLHTGSAMSAWTAGQTFNYPIAASTDFTGGSVGENLGLRIEWEGGISYIDNVSLELVTFIPEPSTAILAGLGLMAVCFRRRKRK